MVSKILENLNPVQKACVQKTKGPLLIKAGAGSGKTRVLTRRIAYLIEHDQIAPYNILAVTFTNAAAKEMRDRIVKLCGVPGEKVFASTFHSFGKYVLQHNADKLGYSKKFSIANASAQITLTKHILKQLGVNTRIYNPRTIHGIISGAKNKLITPSEFQQDVPSGSSTLKVIAAKTYKIYQQRLHKSECLDFDDLLMMTVILFKTYPNILAQFQDQFQYISVDEYQDTNEAQYQMIKLLSRRYHNICVVGDADQSIYGWRGANFMNLVKFKRDNPGIQEINMNENYRSTKNILRAANCVIAHNHKNQDSQKHLWTNHPQGAPITLFQAQTSSQEAEYIAKTIRSEVRKGQLDYSDCAVLYRSNAQSRELEDTMIKFGLPYKIVGNIKFYQRKEIKTVLDYLTAVSNPRNEFALRRIIDYPNRGIGDKTMKTLVTFSENHQLGLLDGIAQVNPQNSGLSSNACRKLAEFRQLILSLHEQAPSLTTTAITKKVLLESKYQPLLEYQARTSETAQERLSNLKEFLSVTKRFDDQNQNQTGLLNQFVTKIMLTADANPHHQQDTDAIELMTIHAAKGEEFKHVFETGLEENIFPTYRSHLDNGKMAEERRLAYVADTRAKDKLTLTYAKKRLIWGHIQRNRLSRFVREIDPRVIKCIQGRPVYNHRRPTQDDDQIYNQLF